MVDITSNILKNIFSNKLTKAKEGIAKSLKTKSFKAIEDYKNSFKFELTPTETKKEDVNVVNSKLSEYIKADGARRRCAGGDGRKTENHDCDKIHSDMSHKEWEASQDTPKDEAKSGGKEAYQKFFNAKLKKYGVKSPAELSDDDKKKFYDEIDKEWEGDNEND